MIFAMDYGRRILDCLIFSTEKLNYKIIKKTKYGTTILDWNCLNSNQSTSGGLSCVCSFRYACRQTIVFLSVSVVCCVELRFRCRRDVAVIVRPYALRLVQGIFDMFFLFICLIRIFMYYWLSYVSLKFHAWILFS